jgi:hypothetical protein
MELIRRPYVPGNMDEERGGDYNLNPSRMWALEQLFPAETWDTTWRHVFGGCAALARENLDLVARSQAASARARRLGQRRIEQLEVRMTYASGQLAVVAAREAELERKLLTALLCDIEEPLLLVDAARLTVVSARMPFESVEEEEEAVP